MPITVAQALTFGSRALEQVPELRPNAARDAALLLRHVSGLSHAGLLARPERPLTPEQDQAYRAAIARRAASEPVQYITGEQEFFGLALRVTPAVLIPRPETELLVEAVVAHLRDQPLESTPLRILDVGTGSGAIALALAHTLPHARVTATDISPEALAVAAANARRHALDHRIRFVAADLLTGPPILYHAVVSNPPYVPEPDRQALAAEVRDYEPAPALFAGHDGLDIYRRLIPEATRALVPNGLLALEFGFAQQPALAAMLHAWQNVRFLPDLQGIPRVALATRPV